ncbi:MAG TPA: hypothetical protein VLJ21_01825 [Candidatus Binatia bacterium]|nr:hypothetical protein [Candidatus Binatia bacterium]
MGSMLEINDTLKISKERGFPAELTLEAHLKKPFTAQGFESRVFEFYNSGLRSYHDAPTPVRLVEEIDGKWLYWGLAHIFKQTRDTTINRTSGKFTIVKIYDPVYQKLVTENESPKGKSFF